MAVVFTQKLKCDRGLYDQGAFDCSGWYVRPDGPPLGWFDIEHETKKPQEVWITLYDCPAKDRYEVEIQLASDGWDTDFPKVVCEDGEFFSDASLDARLKKLVGRTLYLQVEYR